MTETNADASDAPERIALRDVDPELYRHPGEGAALGRLEKAPGFAKLLDLMSDHGGGKAERLVELASMAGVGPGVYPELHGLWKNTLDAFGVGDVPLHISHRDPVAWRLKGGGPGPRAILSSDLLDALPQAEMAALLASLAGSIRLGNLTNIAAAEFLRWVQDYYGVFGAPAFVLSWALESWRRYALMSADRAAVLLCGPEPVRALLDRLSGAGCRSWGGVDPERLRLQGVEATSRDQDWNNSRWRRFFVAMNRRNPGGLVRRVDLEEWLASGAPEKIMSGRVKSPADLAMDGEEVSPPGVAFWGAFAAGSQEAEEQSWRDTAVDLRDMAERGVNSFLKAGEAFFRSLRDERE